MAKDLADYGELPVVLVFVFFSIVFAGVALIIVLDRISYTRLIVHSLIVWVVMVIELYALFSLNVHRRASDQVHTYIHNFMFVVVMYGDLPLFLQFKVHMLYICTLRCDALWKYVCTLLFVQCLCVGVGVWVGEWVGGLVGGLVHLPLGTLREKGLCIVCCV